MLADAGNKFTSICVSKQAADRLIKLTEKLNLNVQWVTVGLHILSLQVYCFSKPMVRFLIEVFGS